MTAYFSYTGIPHTNLVLSSKFLFLPHVSYLKIFFLILLLVSVGTIDLWLVLWNLQISNSPLEQSFLSICQWFQRWRYQQDTLLIFHSHKWTLSLTCTQTHTSFLLPKAISLSQNKVTGRVKRQAKHCWEFFSPDFYFYFRNPPTEVPQYLPRYPVNNWAQRIGVCSYHHGKRSFLFCFLLAPTFWVRARTEWEWWERKGVMYSMCVGERVLLYCTPYNTVYSKDALKICLRYVTQEWSKARTFRVSQDRICMDLGCVR